MMKVTNCNNLFKKLISLLLINSFILTPVLALPNTSGGKIGMIKKETKNQPSQAQDIDEDDPIQRAEYYDQLHKYNHQRHQQLRHIIEILKIASSKYLNKGQKDQFLPKIDSIKTELAKHAPVLETSLSALLECNTQLAGYLATVLKKQLKNIDPFIFEYAPKKSEPSTKELKKKTEVLENNLKAIEEEFQNLGVSSFQRWSHKLTKANNKYNVTGTLKKLGALALICGYVRVRSKQDQATIIPNPNQTTANTNPVDLLTTLLGGRAGIPAQDDQAQATADPNNNNNNNAQAAASLQPAAQVPTGQINPVQPPQLPGPQNPSTWARIKNTGSSFLGYFDQRLGSLPVEDSFLDRSGRPRTYIRQPGAGFAGWIYSLRYWAEAIGIATGIKLGAEKLFQNMQDWKAFHKSPTDFLKLGVLLNDQEQKVSPLEELFILRALERIQPRLTLKDIIGLEDQKKEIWPIINFVLNPNMYNATNTTIEKGVLLYGPTRTGKSLFAEAMAGTLETLGKELSFFKIKCSELRGIMGIDKILETIDKLPGVKIAFFDEMDLLNLQRDGDKTMLSDFLNNMGKHNIIIIGATNRIDHFDQALLQAGRFGKRIAFVNPPLHTRIEFFRDKLTKMNILDDSLDLQRLGIETDNCSFGDLESIVNDAVAKATQKKQTLAYHHFDAALDTFKRNITSLEIPLPEAERRLIATHLSGHAMAFELLPTSESLHKFTMLPIKKHILEEKVWLSDIQTPKKITYFGDVYTLHKTNTGGFDTFEQKINMVKVLLAGHVAEKVMLGSTSYSYHNEDNEKARAILEALVFKGIKKDNVSKKECNKKMEEVMALFDKYEQETTEFIIANKDKLVKMIDALLVRKTLTQEDVQKLIGLQPQQPMAAAAA